jgi:hypothetical protein
MHHSALVSYLYLQQIAGVKQGEEVHITFLVTMMTLKPSLAYLLITIWDIRLWAIARDRARRNPSTNEGLC